MLESEYARKVEAEKALTKKTSREEQLGLLALKAKHGDAQAATMIAQELGVDPNDEGIAELYDTLAETWGKFKVEPQKEPDYRIINDQLLKIGPEGVNVAHTAPQRGGQYKPNYKLIEQPGPDGNIQKYWIDENSGPQGTPIPFGDPYKGTKDPKLTEGERVSANYAGRMRAAEEKIGTYKPNMKDYMGAVKMMEGGPVSASIANKFIISEQGQLYYQAAADWVRAKLRKESGAVIPPDEMVQEIKIYFPMPGDSQEVIVQKAQARAQALTGMEGMAGNADAQIAPPIGNSGAAPPANLLKEGVITTFDNGQSWKLLNGQPVRAK
jgi:hypothetical protein